MTELTKTKTRKGTIGILTGGGDVPGLNPAIRAVTIRALREGYRMVGIKRGWRGLVDIVRDFEADNTNCFEVLTESLVNRIARSGGTFLHSSRTRPNNVKKNDLPEHLQDVFKKDVNDLTPEVLKNLEFLGVNFLIAIGGDDTLSYAAHLHQQGFKVVAIPKTMDNDVPGTDYCIGFSTCVTRTIDLANQLRTSAGSHERFLVLEVFGRYAGFTALMPAMAGAANRCLIPEYQFDIEKLTEMMVRDWHRNPSHYSVVLISEGAMFSDGEMIFSGDEVDAYGHKKLGGIGSMVGQKLQELSANYNNGRMINTIEQRLGYIVRSGNPDALDSFVPIIFGNLAFDLIQAGKSGRLVSLRNGKYGDVRLETVIEQKKIVDVEKYYNTERYRPLYKNFHGKPLMIMTSDV
ncbi:MAG: ATP-dependent 6-phosphofructokinase [Candidatus Delongbacteria bacterium]|nr:ATP-dependent 6-phosphofructokinase [bacterium]MBL7033451.1 ATP-dependent 6-phosphofructokinase [Candidatus Delongbacteria bacterium]